jgi:hypothetical protein
MSWDTPTPSAPKPKSSTLPNVLREQCPSSKMGRPESRLDSPITDQRSSLALRCGDWLMGGQQPMVRATGILKGSASRHHHRAQRAHQSAVWHHARGALCTATKSRRARPSRSAPGDASSDRASTTTGAPKLERLRPPVALHAQCASSKLNRPEQRHRGFYRLGQHRHGPALEPRLALW